MRRRGRRACEFFYDPRFFGMVIFASRVSEEGGRTATANV